MTMTPEQIKKLVGRRFFTVTFIKKGDGSTRVMNARVAIKKYVKGTGHPIEDGRLGTWDRQKFSENLKSGMKRWDAGHSSYRSLWPDSILSLKVGHKIYDKDGKEIKEKKRSK